MAAKAPGNGDGERESKSSSGKFPSSSSGSEVDWEYVRDLENDGEGLLVALLVVVTVEEGR